MTGSSSSSPQPSSSTGKSSGYWVDGDGTAHEECKLLFFIRNNCLGEVAFDPGDWPALRYRRTGLAYFCRSCGDVWARVALVNHHGQIQDFEAFHVGCERHWDQWNISGSLLAGELEALLDLLPAPVLKREFLIHLRMMEE